MDYYAPPGTREVLLLSVWVGAVGRVDEGNTETKMKA